MGPWCVLNEAPGQWEWRCCTRLAGVSPAAVSQPGRRVAGCGRSMRVGCLSAASKALGGL